MLFDDDGASVADTRALPSIRFQTNPSSAKSRFDLGLSSYSSEPVDEEIHIKDHNLINTGVETDSSQKPQDDALTKPGPSGPPVILKPNKDKPVPPFSLLQIHTNVYDTMK